MLRVINIIVIAALITSASYVYKIKFEATVQAQKVAKLRSDVRKERDAIATLRAEWAALNNPERLQQLSKRILTLRPMDPTQFDRLDKLPEKPTPLVPPGTSDPIGAIIESIEDDEVFTSSAGASGGTQ